MVFLINYSGGKLITNGISNNPMGTSDKKGEIHIL